MSKIDFSFVTKGIEEVIIREEPFLTALDSATISTKLNIQNRSIKQILGHLVDSASNNHQRMIRLQYNEHLIFPDYRQDNDLWIALQDYQHYDWKNLIQLWKLYNLHIIHIIDVVKTSTLFHDWHDFEGNTVTLGDMIAGYLEHLHLHIDQIHELAEK